MRKLFLAETNESFSDIETIRPSGLALCTLAQLSALQVRTKRKSLWNGIREPTKREEKRSGSEDKREDKK